MFTAMAHRPLVWLLAALALLGAGWVAYGPLRQSMQPATDTAERAPRTEPATTTEDRPAASSPAGPREPSQAVAPAAPAPAAPETAAAGPEPVPPAEPARGAPAPAPAPSASPAGGSTARLDAPPAPSAPRPPAPTPTSAGPTVEGAGVGELAPAAGPTPPPPAAAPLEPTPEGSLATALAEPAAPIAPDTGAPLEPTPGGSVTTALAEPAAPIAPEAGAPAVVEPLGQAPVTGPAAVDESPEARQAPAGKAERPTDASEIARATPLPATEPAAPEADPEATEPAPGRSLSLDTIRRALAALLGGAPEPTAPAGRQVEKPAPKPAAVKPDQPRDVAKAVAPSTDPPDGVRPSFDIVRVGSDGRAVIAGRAAPGAEVELLSGDRVLDRVRANRRGEWISTPSEPFAPGALELSLRAVGDGTPALRAEQVVVVVVPEPPPPQPPPVAVAEGPPPQPPEVKLAEASTGPLAVLLGGDGRAPGRILQAPGRISSDGQLALLVLDYDDSGRTRLMGEAPPGAPLRIYVDNEPAGEAIAEPSGRWTAVLGRDLKPGDYTLRLDQLGSQGHPVARLETPFTRVSQPPIEGKTEVDYVIVQPGNSLWRIARRLFGSGMEYVHIYDANQAQIRDPDLIYPGQVFEIPAGVGSAG